MAYNISRNTMFSSLTPFCRDKVFKMWSTKYLSKYWTFANYVALLDDSRWAKRILHWNPGGGRRGRSFSNGNSTSTSTSTLYAHWAACFRHRGEIVKLHPIYINTCKPPKIEAGLNAKVRHQLQRPPMKVNSSRLQKFVIKVSQEYFGRPLRLCPCGAKLKPS